MIQKETYSLENIKRIKDKYNVDPELAQRSIFALGLVETLSMVGTDFIFKGGSSLMLLNETPKRLSIPYVKWEDVEMSKYIDGLKI